MRTNLLFICSSAIDRSQAATDLFVDSNKYLAIAAGTHLDATKEIDQKLIDWADYIFVMSEGTNKHKTYLIQNFTIKGKKIFDLHVRDMYFRNDPRLKELLRRRISKIINF